jgi:hypothetical protein
MSSVAIPVKLQPRTAACHSVATWCSESALLVCSFEYRASLASTPATVAERIDAALGIAPSAPRALLGDVELTWKDESRLHSIELRTGRAQWQRSSLGTPTEPVEEMSMTLELDYDINRIASIELEVRVLWDPTLARIALRFGNGERRTARWVSIADNVFLDVDDEQSLREIRFANVQFVTDDPS